MPGDQPGAENMRGHVLAQDLLKFLRKLFRGDGRLQTFRIVGEYEADPGCRSIAYVSLLARHRIGKQVSEAAQMCGHEIEIVAVE